MAGEGSKPYLLLDAGGTILYPNAPLIAGIAGDMGFSFAEKAFFKSFFAALHELDRMLYKGEPFPGDAFLFQKALKQLGMDRLGALAVLEALDRRKEDVWTYTLPLVEPALVALQKAGYKMSVVSNSDGRVQEKLEAVNLAPFFDRIFDSGLLGVEKPDQRIFRHALTELGIEESAIVYVGDVMMIDIYGANGVGMAGIHIDNGGLYQDWPGLHVPNINVLAEILVSKGLDLNENNLFPFRKKEQI